VSTTHDEDALGGSESRGFWKQETEEEVVEDGWLRGMRET